jgi:hypothetical protein
MGQSFPPRYRNHVADEEMEPKARKLPGAIRWDRHRRNTVAVPRKRQCPVGAHADHEGEDQEYGTEKGHDYRLSPEHLQTPEGSSSLNPLWLRRIDGWRKITAVLNQQVMGAA